MNIDPKILIVAAIAALVLFVLTLKGKSEWLLNLLMRSILGTVAIFFINEWLNDMGISMRIGVNPITVLTSGVLGFPGLLALYGIGFYKNL